MNRKLRYPFFLAVALGATASAVTPVAAQPAAAPAAPGDADELYKQGIAAFKEGKLEDAYKLLTRAWEKKQSVDIAANLGVVEMKLGKPRDAADHLAYALKLYPVGGDAEARSILETRYQEARKAVGAVRVACNQPGAAIQVDGESLGKAPMTDEKFVDPGQRKFTAVLEGFENGEVLVKIEPGSDITVEIKLTPKPKSDGPGPVVVPEDKPLWPVFALAGLGAVGLGMGIGFVVMSESAKSEIEDSPCRSAACAGEYQDQVDSYNLGVNIGVPALAVGGLALAGMIVYLAWPGPDEPAAADQKPTAWVLPILGPDNAGLAVGGKF